MYSILWVEDDYYHLKGLFRQLEKEGFEIVNASSANDAYHKLQEWQKYDVIVIDTILPLRDQRVNNIAPEVERWKDEKYIGIGLLHYIIDELKVTVPIVALSVATDELSDVFEEIGVTESLLKRGLLPRQVKDTIHAVLGLNSDD